MLIFLSFPLVSLAKANSNGAVFNNPVPSLRGKTLSNIVGHSIKVVLGLVGIIALILFVAAGFIWMTAQGNPQKIQTAQKIMLWAGIGLFIILSSYALLNFIINRVQTSAYRQGVYEDTGPRGAPQGEPELIEHKDCGCFYFSTGCPATNPVSVDSVWCSNSCGSGDCCCKK